MNASAMSPGRAALRLGLSYNQVMRLVYTRAIAGAQDEHGRWRLDAASVERFAATRDTGSAPAVA